MQKDKWIRQLKKGDIIKENGSGTLRIVRCAKHTAKHTYITLSILHCSWTGRCYTVISDSTIRSRFSPVGAKWHCRTKIDRLIGAAINQDCHEPYVIDCCDVKGIT